MGPVGLKHSLLTLHHIIRVNNPSVIVLQDCRVRPNDEATMLQTLREQFVDFHPFISSGFHQRTNHTSKCMSGQMRNQRRYYPFSVTVMVHHTCGTVRVQSYTTPTSTRHEGRMLTVHVHPPSPLLPFQVTSYYIPVADASEDQRECLETLCARLTVSAHTGCLHIVGDDFNASLFPVNRYAYTDLRYRQTLEETDNMFSDFIHHPELLHKWWNAGIRSGLLSCRGGCGTKGARLDEVHILNPTDLHPNSGMRSGRGHRYVFRTWHHDNSRLDHATILADIPGNFCPPRVPQGLTRDK